MDYPVNNTYHYLCELLSALEALVWLLLVVAAQVLAEHLLVPECAVARLAHVLAVLVGKQVLMRVGAIQWHCLWLLIEGISLQHQGHLSYLSDQHGLNSIDLFIGLSTVPSGLQVLPFSSVKFS